MIEPKFTEGPWRIEDNYLYGKEDGFKRERKTKDSQS